MPNKPENLGRPVAWQIRDIPETIREMVVEQARAEKVLVPDLVTRLVLDARAAGWSFTASNGFANPSNTADPAVAEVVALLNAAGTLPEHIPLPSEVRSLINDRARQARGRSATKPGKPLQLEAPAEPT